MKKLKQGQRLVSVDPGLGNTGYALWRGDVVEAAGLLHAPRGGELWERADALAHELRELIEDTYKCLPVHVICEMPEWQGGGGRSLGWQTGGMQSLTFLVGVFCGVLGTSHHWRHCTPREWKGQLPKELAAARIRSRLGRQTCERLRLEKDVWDAVGIGLWAQGRF